MNDYCCSVCGGKTEELFSNGKDFFVNDGASSDFSIYFCEGCGLAFSFPAMNNEELASYYPDDYEAFVVKKSFAALLQVMKYKSDLRIILRELKKNNHLSIFEIGAGRGEFLYEAKRIGLKAEGIEPGESGVKFAKNNYGIELQTGFASDIKFIKKYDVIILRHVLEHVNDFYGCLKQIIDTGLKQGGYLFIKVPRMDSWEAVLFGKFWSGFDLPRHRVHFSKAGIVKMLNNLGYVNVKVKSEVVPTDIMRSINYYSKHGNSALLKFLSKGFTALPNIFKIGLSQITGVLLSSFGTGRMIVMAFNKRSDFII